MAGVIRQMMARRRSSAVSEYVEAMKNEYLLKVSACLGVTKNFINGISFV